MRFQLLLGSVLLCQVLCEEEHDHDHGHAFEWAGVFEISTVGYSHSLVILRHDGMPSDFSTGIIVVPTATGDMEGLEEAEEAVEAIMEAANATDASGVDISISVGVMYEVSVSPRSWAASLNINFTSPGFYAIFLEHGMEEHCPDGECFRDSSGVIVEPLAVEGAHDVHGLSSGGGKKWSPTMGGAFVVWSAVFTGIVLLGCGSSSYDAMSSKYVHLISMFAAGALLATAFCIILLEASHFISSGGRDEAESSGIWGSVILLGFLTATVIDIVKEAVLVVISGQKEAVAPSQAAMDDSKEVAVYEPGVELGSCANKTEEKASLSSSLTQKANGIVISILVGDFFHNFCDGIFIGAAFQSCSISTGWTIVGTTVCHELAQEIADFVILTKTAGVSVPVALTINAFSGLSVVIGGIVVTATSLSDLWIGILLAFGSGNYIYLAASELFPSIHSSDAKLLVHDKLAGVMLFALGACAIGLVLLNHQHCEVSADTGEDAHNH